MRRSNYNRSEAVATELLFQSMLGTDIQRQKANMRLSRQGLPGSLRTRCRQRSIEMRSRLGSAVACCQRRQEHKYPIYPTTSTNRVGATRHPNRPPATSSSFGWDILQNVDYLLTGASYASGTIGGAQVGMLKYRQSLPIDSRVLSFPKFAQYYRGLGVAQRSLGKISRLGIPISTYSDYKSMRQGRISETRFAYRSSGTASSLITSLVVGGASGAGWGAFVAFVFAGGEVAYEVVTNLIDEFTKGIAEAEQALRSGIWIPGY